MSGEHSHPEYALAGPAAAEFVALQMAVEALTGRVAALEGRQGFALDYAYLDKPSEPQTIGRSYVRLDQSLWNPPGPGWEHTLRYLNIQPIFRAGRMAGALRPRLMRENGDATDYDDIPLLLDALDNDGHALITHPYWEWGDDKATWIEVKCIGGLESAVLSTRYTKKALLRPT